jgi:WD40 repeat protein
LETRSILEADYQLALKLWPPQDTGRQQVLAAFQELLRRESLRIAQSPEWLFTTFYNYLRWLDAPDGPLYRLCEAAVARRQGQNSVLPLLLRSRFDPRLELPPWLRSLEGHTGAVNAVALSPDGRFIVSGSG